MNSEEFNHYESIYRSEESGRPEIVRHDVFSESEDFFRGLLESHCRGREVLEIGCGDGRLSVALAKIGASKVCAIDFSPAAIERARATALTAGVAHICQFEVQDAHELSQYRSQFDVVVDQEVFSSLDFERLLPQLYDCLRANGVLIGIECIGHNPIFNLNRTIGVLRGRRTKWASDHILKMSEIDRMREKFSEFSIQYFHMLGVLGDPVLSRLPEKLRSGPVKLLRALDQSLLRAVPAMSFKAVFMGRR